MPAQTQLLSAIAGVTVYATRALALAGVDSGVAFDTWMRAQTTSSASPMTLTWDGFIKVADMAADYLQLTPSLTGWITHVPATAVKGGIYAVQMTARGTGYTGTPTVTISAPAGGGTTATAHVAKTGNTVSVVIIDIPGDGYLPSDTITVTISGGSGSGATAVAYISGNCGAVWAVKTVAIPCCALGSFTGNTSLWSATAITDVNFVKNPNGVGTTLDFGYPDGGTQPHDGATFGWSFGFVAAGVNRLLMDGVTLLNPRTFATCFVGAKNVSIPSMVIDVGIHPAQFNYDGLHFLGPSSNIAIGQGPTAGNVVIRSSDDALAIIANEPLTNDTSHYLNAPYLSGWTGGNVAHVRASNVVFNDAISGVRLLSVTPGQALQDIILDGFSGTVNNQALAGSNYNDQGFYPTACFDSVIIRNFTLSSFQANGNATYKGRYYFSGCIFASTYFQSIVDQTSISSFTIDVATLPFPLIYRELSADMAQVAWVPTLSGGVTDNFVRANTALGGVANGWTDVSTQFKVNNNLLTSNAPAAASALLREAVGETVANQYIRVLWTLNATGGVGALLRWQSSSAVYTVNADPTGGVGIYGNGGTNRNLQTWPSPTVGHVYWIDMYAIGGTIYAQMVDGTTGRLVVPAVAVNDGAAIAGTGFAGLQTYQASGSGITFPQIITRQVSGYATLTTLTVANAGQADADGYIPFTATPSAGAYPYGGVWSLSAAPAGATIDNFGRVRGLAAGQSATVTYAIGGVTSNALAYTAPGTGGGGGGSVSVGGFSLSL